jgi:formylglycine-generating enzyme required for sulfatase activity
MAVLDDRLKKLKVFVNYRRSDNKIFVELLRTHFMFRYGQENVFMDFDSLPPFTNFEEFIRETVRASDVVAMMIGKRWMKLMRAKAAQGGNDYVLIELEEALKHNKVIAPICILGAEMPPIPPSLKPIAHIQAEFVSNGRHLRDDVNRIMNGFEAELERRGAPRSVRNPASQQHMQEAVTHASSTGLDEMLDRFADAAAANDLPQAVIRIAQLRASGQAIPAEFELDRRELELQARLREEEDHRRRREAADFQYKFVRRMIKLGDPAEKIKAAVNAIWQIDAGYVPDDLAPEIGKLIGSGTPSAPHPSIAVTSFTLPLLEWINIPAGSVTLVRGWDGLGWGFAENYSQAPLGTYPVGPFAMGKYPVTNAQHQAFIADGGYEEDRWWQGLARRFTEPRKAVCTIENHPRDAVSWYEAVAFCRWLSAKTGRHVSLPTESQWQYAAQGSDGRAFPWGSTFDKSLCNTRESGIGKTTPVDRYPNGRSPFGVSDMAGNVWEWCLNEYADLSHVDTSGAAARVVRGGSWCYDQDRARAAYRNAYGPGIRSDNVGFRVVGSSLLPSSVLC